MALVLKRIYQNYDYVLNELKDPTTDGSFLTSQLFVILFVGGYVLFVNKLGPNLMKSRKPYNIRNLIIFYNVIQILLNVYMFGKAAFIYKQSQNWICLDIRDEYKYLLTSGRYEFILLKMLDCVDTVFFVLKKNNRQVSFLHVYHHAGMVLCAWLTLTYEMGVSIIFTALVNSVVHIAMFVYYLLTSIDPKWNQNITLKKSVTQMQLIQFVMLILFYGLLLIIPNCRGASPVIGVLMWIIQNIFMATLFGEFYIRTYWRNNKKTV